MASPASGAAGLSGTRRLPEVVAAPALPPAFPGEGSAAVRKVLLTADTLGGVWTFALQLIDQLAAIRVQVVLATMGQPLSPTQRRDVQALDNCQLEESAYRLEWMPEPWAEVDAAGHWLQDLEQRHRPDVVHLNTLAHAHLPFRAPRLVTVHSCVYSWHHHVRGRAPDPAAWGEYHRRVTQSLQAATMITAPTQAAASYVRHYGIDSRRVRVIPNGLDAQRFQPNRPKEPVLLAAGRFWDEGKNLNLLRQLAHKLPWPCLVAGESRDERPDPDTRLRCLGRLERDAMADAYARSAIFVHPALYEPFGLAPLEAALSGCALILGDLDTLREVWGDAALFIDPRDAECLLRAVTTLTQNPSLRADLAARAVHHAQRYGARASALHYLRCYAEVSPARVAGER